MSDRFVTIATYHDGVAAAMARNFLENEHIPVLLLDEDTVATFGVISAAIGGVKLQVPAIHVERAELLLSQIQRDTDDYEPMPPTAIATPEIAEELREEHTDRDPLNQNVDRLLRAALGGLIFLPLQFYALWLLMEIASTEGKVTPNRHWKIWVSMLLNGPILAAIVIPLLCLLNWLWP